VGVLQILSVLEKLEHSAVSEAVHWKIFLQADEEIFSRYSRKNLMRFSKGADLGLVFEFAWYEPDNDQYIIPIQVGGNMAVTFNIERQTNHAGVSTELGRNANDIAAEVVQAFSRLRKSGISVRVSSIHSQDLLGGKSTLTLRFRYSTVDERAKINRRLLALKQRYSTEANLFDYKISDIWEPHDLNIPDALLHAYGATAAELGFKKPIGRLTRTHDAASFISRQGVPVLTSVGLPGQGSHSADEIVYLGDFSRRTDLVCGVILKMLAKT
jgi:acetylornithine deacetylase/succinyl-diaminopimelate desuccinylase-like protein